MSSIAAIPPKRIANWDRERMSSIGLRVSLDDIVGQGPEGVATAVVVG